MLTMIQQVEVKRLRATTLFRIYFTGFLLTLYPLIIIAGVAAAFGADTMKSGNVQVHGWKALAESIFVPPVFAFFASLLWLAGTWPGLWLYSKFKNTGLSFYTPDPDHSSQRREASVNAPSTPQV